ncbi:MAG: hypothetical protein ACHQAX_04605 [Gammaproteobacteria bacterium]
MNNLAWMDQATREANLKKFGLQSILNKVMPMVPHHPLSPFNPSTWAQALRSPPIELFQRMIWSATVFDATQAEAVKPPTQKRSHKKKEENLSDDELTAGELDKNYNSPAAIEAQQLAAEANKTTIMEEVLSIWNKNAQFMAIAAAEIAKVYHDSFAKIRDELGIAEQDHMTDEQLKEWTQQNQGPVHLGIRGYLLDQIAEHAQHFSLEQVAVADRFLDRMTAMLMKGGKGLNDLEKLTPGLIASAYDQHHLALNQLANKMESAAVNALKQLGTALPSPMPPPTLNMNVRINNQLLLMNAPGLTAAPLMDPAHRMDQLRLAVIKLLNPNVPQPANALNQKIAPNVEQTSHEAIKGELEHYAKAIGVGLSTMGKAADRMLLQHLWPTSNPNHTATKQLMQDNPLAAVEPAHKSLAKREMEKAMKPHQQGT